MSSGDRTGEVTLVPVQKGFSETSVNAVIFRKHSLFSYQDSQYIAFYDADGGMVLGKRQLGTTEWELHPTGWVGDVMDAHNSISIIIDGSGYLHVAWDHHNHSLNYARSIAPGSLELGEKQQLSEASRHHRVTYPEFYLLPDGNLLFMYRHGRSGDGFQVLHHYDAHRETWELLHEQLIDGQGDLNPYWQTVIDSHGTLHLSWNWRRHAGVESNHDLAYARSRDGGRTWEQSDGTPYELPITPQTAEVILHIPENSSMMNQTSMAADSRGQPYIVGYWVPEDSRIPQYHCVFFSDNGWQVSQVGRLTEEFELRGRGTMAPPISRPQIVVDDSEEYERVYVLFRARERGNRVSVAISQNLMQGEWEFADLTDWSVDSWEPGYDPVLWSREKILHIFLQRVGQADHEQAVELEPQMVYVLEWHP